MVEQIQYHSSLDFRHSEIDLLKITQMMKRFIVLGIAVVVSAVAQAQSFPKETEKVVLVIHGGAGTIRKNQMSANREKAYQSALSEALRKGYDVIQKGGSALDATEAAVRILEDNTLFNAGKGAVFTNKGKNG